ncbi:MAG: hypothetical protein ACQETO_04880 [Pseudomonadota bacterium]
MIVRRRSLLSALAAVPLFLGVSAGRADVLVDYVTSSNDGNVSERVQFAIKEDVLRFSVNGAVATSDYYIYNRGRQRVVYLQPARTAYYELRPGMLQDAAENLRAQRDRLEGMLEDLEELDEQTRERVRTALDSIENASGQVDQYSSSTDQAQPRLGASKGEITLDGMTCTLYEVRMVQAPLEACYAEPEELGLTAAQASLIQEFQEQLTASTGVANMYSLVPGRLPLVAAYGSLDQPEALVVRFEGLTEVSLPNAGFIIPDSYTEVSTQMPDQ